MTPGPNQLVRETGPGVGYLTVRAGNEDLTILKFGSESQLSQLRDRERGTVSVYRFKGQEAAAVILADVDPDPEQLDRAWRLLYCGMTRATVRLELLVNDNNPECRRFSKA